MIESRIEKQEHIEWRKLKWLQPSTLKSVEDEDITKLKTSLKNNDFIQPFNVWHDGTTTWILDGHHRQRAMTELEREGVKIAELLPANFIRCKDRSDAAKMVLLYSSMYAQITKKGLVEFADSFNLDLEDIAFEIDLPSINLDSIVNSISEEATSSVDEIPETSDTIFTEKGDIYKLGNHVLVCGDSTQSDDWQKLMGDEKAELVFTDPPYNVSINHISVAAKEGNDKHGDFAMAAGEMTVQEFTEFLTTVVHFLQKYSTDGSLHFLCMDWRHIHELTNACRDYSEWKQLIVWKKAVAGMGTFYRSQHELIFCYKNGTQPHINNFELGQYGRYRTNVWEYDGAAQFSQKNSATSGSLSDHPTPKNTQMIVDCILDCSNKGGIVVDAFGGSGTTLIAADIAGRTSRLMEYEPKYCDVIVRRYAKYCAENGKKCDIEKNGKPFIINSL